MSQKLTRLPAATVCGEAGEQVAPSTREEDDAFGVIGQVRGVKPRLPAVGGIGEREQDGRCWSTLYGSLRAA